MSEIEMRLLRLERCSRRLSVAFIGLVAVPLVFATAGCSSWRAWTRAPHNLAGAPFYKSFSNSIHPQNGGVGHLPVTVDAEGMSNDQLYALRSLLDGIDSFLDSLGWSARLDTSSLPAKGAPYVDVRSEEVEGGRPEMILWTGKPSARWRDALSHIAEEATVEYVLYVSLGLSEYSKRTRPVNSREVELGTGYKMRLGLTADLDEPLAVVHIKGMLLDRHGKIVRAGAEGIIARDTELGERLIDKLFADLIGGEVAAAEITADDIAGLSTEERREDLPGQPLKWKVATQNLLAQLLMREEVLRD